MALSFTCDMCHVTLTATSETPTLCNCEPTTMPPHPPEWAMMRKWGAPLPVWLCGPCALIVAFQHQLTGSTAQHQNTRDLWN